MLRSILLSLPFLVLIGTSLKGVDLSSQAEIHLLTAAPGAELYSAYGHSAFRILDPASGIDRIYNYGTFDFDTPGFYTKFVRGKLPYYLSTQSLRSFQRQYVREQRAVVDQTLELGPEQVQAVFDYLETNMRPENRAYQYDFFFDNCATRERDVLESVLGDDLQWPNWPVDSLGTFRNLIDIYLEPLHWADFGIDLCLGLPTDEMAGVRNAQFLPDFLYAAVKQGKVKREGRWKSLVRKERAMVSPEMKQMTGDPEPGPFVVMWSLFGLAVLLTSLLPMRHWGNRLFDTFFFFAIGCAGLLMLFLWAATDHQATFSNFNVFWAWPTHIFFAFMRWGKEQGQSYARIGIAGLAVFLLASLFIPQNFHGAIWPLVLTLLLRLVAVVGATVNLPASQK